MSFDSEDREISDIFEGQKIYYVPRYQRNYVWTKTNWSELLADIKFTITKDDSKINWSHFIGAIVLKEEEVEDNILKITPFEIIDGQQRLTTIFVILISICSRLQILGEEDYAQYIINTYIRINKPGGKKQYKFVNEKLTSDFDKILQAALDKTSDKSKSIINELYNYYCTEFSNYDFEMLKTFLSKLLSINIVKIISKKDEEIYNIFEVLNARGQRLMQLELLKNRVMKYITPRENDAIDKAKQDWSELENNLVNISNTDVFLQHFAKCFINKPIDNKYSVYKLIKENIKIEDLDNLLKNLINYSYSYRIIYNKNNENHYIKYFDITRNQQIRSVLAALHKKIIVDFDDKDLYEKVLKELRNYFFIYNLTKQPSNKINNIITDFAYKIYNVEEKVELIIQISSMFYTLNKYIPNTESFNHYLLTNPTLKYSNVKQSGFTRNAQFVRYFLYEIYMESERDTEIDYENLTIEHICGDTGDDRNSSISNLTLLKRKPNEKLKNKPPKEKIEIIQKESTIQENKKLADFLENDDFSLEKRMEWFVKKIKSGTLLFNPEILNIKKDEVEKYNKNYDIVKNDEELCMLLKKYGKYFEEKLNKDKDLKDYKERLDKLKNI